jgi:predicted Rossmann fold flavoprotein
MLREFFAELKVELVEEEDGNLFPATQSAKTVLGALLDERNRCGVRTEHLKKAARIEAGGAGFLVSGAGFSYEARTVILATGGLSYPETGSDGSGYALARSLGHSVVPTTPALVPLKVRDAEWNSLSGITLPAELSLVLDGKKTASAKGPLLFTHVGISGPGVMDLSRHWVRLEDRGRAELLVNFLPHVRAEQFLGEIEKTAKEQPALSLKRALVRYFPERLAEVLVRKGGLDPMLQMAHCSKKDRQALVRAVFSLKIEVSGAFGYEKAEVTAGGVALSEVDPKTLESRLCPGLFFAGEILDVDGRIGGFNLQWAWASGYAAGGAAVKKLETGPVRGVSDSEGQ